jgi:uncharacterized protein (DUF305 family)
VRAATPPFVTAALVAAVLGGCSSGSGDGGDGDGAAGDDRARTVQPGAPGEESRELSDDEAAAAVAVPEHTAADTAFMQGMIVHHRQAVVMAALVEDRTGRDDLPTLAQRITETQEAEIAQLEAWLTERDEELPAEDDDGSGQDHAHASHDMAGMATPEQLEALEAAEGPAFDRLFLDLMIAHHQGALTMVLELYGAEGGLEPAADRVARDIEADQTIEITRMQELLGTLP